MWNMNSGYEGYSMSTRAVEAYESGEKPLSRWTKEEIISAIADLDEKKAELFKKVTLPVLKDQVLSFSSWHHTSSHCNRTDFYSINEAYVERISEDEILALCKEKKKAEVKSYTYKGTIRYLEWSGTRRHPKAKEKILENVDIEERGCFYYVFDETGKQILKKKIFSNGTRVINLTEIEERERFVRNNSSQKALEYYDSIKGSCSRSCSNHLYKYGRKPTRSDYDSGLDKFFEIGEHRLYEERGSGVLHLETWNGSEWIQDENVKKESTL